jgi:hypothetical protein
MSSPNMEKHAVTEDLNQQESSSPGATEPIMEDSSVKKTFWQKQREPGRPLPIIAAALLAIAIGLAVSTQTEVPDAAVEITGIIGNLWLRALRATGELESATESGLRY